MRIELEVFANNTAAIRLYEKVGFVWEGTMRDAVLIDGTFHDVHTMAIVDRTL